MIKSRPNHRLYQQATRDMKRTGFDPYNNHATLAKAYKFRWSAWQAIEERRQRRWDEPKFKGE